MGRWAQKSRRGGGGQPLPASNIDVVFTNAYARFSGLFRYALDFIADNEQPYYHYDSGGAVYGAIEPITDPPAFVGWIIQLNDGDTGDQVTYWASTDALVPPANPAAYTLTPPAGYDPSTKPGTLVSITPR